jgi:predicted GTPase
VSRRGVVASSEEILQMAIIGIPRLAERIIELPDEQRERALKAVEQSYLQTVLDTDSAEDEARQWVGRMMDTLRAEVADRARDETEITVGHEHFASLERLMKLLVRPGPATSQGG